MSCLYPPWILAHLHYMPCVDPALFLLVGLHYVFSFFLTNHSYCVPLFICLPALYTRLPPTTLPTAPAAPAYQTQPMANIAMAHKLFAAPPADCRQPLLPRICRNALYTHLQPRRACLPSLPDSTDLPPPVLPSTHLLLNTACCLPPTTPGLPTYSPTLDRQRS